MSFILDALRKSENERQRQVGPSLADVPVRDRTYDKPWWAVAVAALLVINLGVLVIVLMRDREVTPSPRAPSASQPAAPGTAAAGATIGGTQVPLPATESRIPRDDALGRPAVAPPSPARSLADEAALVDAADSGYESRALAAAASVPEGPALVTRIDAPSVTPLPAPPPPAANPEASTEILPTIHEIGASLPEMHLDIHVYSANPAERFVYVNMRKYNEGQTLSEGPRVERIEADGVVLNHQGRRFVLPRQ